MPDSLDPTELLAAAKPLPTYEIEPAHLDAMITRVASIPARSRFSLLRTWQMRAGSGVAAVALVVTGVVVSLGGAPQGLTVFALSAGSSVAGPVRQAPSPTPSDFATAQLPGTLSTPNFVAGTHLSSTTTSLPVYRVDDVASPVASVAGVATALGSKSATVSTKCTTKTPGEWNALGTKGVVAASPYVYSLCRSSFVATSSPLTWTYNLKASTCPEPSSLALGVWYAACHSASTFNDHGATKSQLVQWSAPLIRSLETRQLVPTGMSMDPSGVTVNANAIYYPLATSNGFVTNQYEEFQFTNLGQLIYATGPLAAVTLQNTYPVISPAAGVALLAPATKSSASGVNLGGSVINATTTINPGGPMIPAPTTTINPGGPMISATTTTTSPTPSVTLTTSSVSYQLIWLANGAALLVPQYTYRASRGLDQRVLALSPSYYRVKAAK
jgi:hypothetical protein